MQHGILLHIDGEIPIHIGDCSVGRTHLNDVGADDGFPTFVCYPPGDLLLLL